MAAAWIFRGVTASRCGNSTPHTQSLTARQSSRDAPTAIFAPGTESLRDVQRRVDEVEELHGQCFKLDED